MALNVRLKDLQGADHTVNLEHVMDRTVVRQSGKNETATHLTFVNGTHLEVTADLDEIDALETAARQEATIF